MENASKALIIAGAILLSIVLITLGVVIIGRGQEAVDQTNIDDQVLSTWNQKWTQYEGKVLTGTTVNNLLNSIISSNATAAKNNEKEKVITLVTSGTTGGLAQDTTQVYACLTTGGNDANTGLKKITTFATPAKKYKVTFGYNPKGYVCTIQVDLAS